MVGFVDATIPIGSQWPRSLSSALAVCQTFIPLITPRYFQSRPCGREWQIFAERVIGYEAEHIVDSALLKPVLWIPMVADRMPSVAQDVQHTTHALGDTYQRMGMRQLMRLQRHRDDYREVIFELAQQIVASVEANELPSAPIEPDFNQRPSAFHPESVSLRDVDRHRDALDSPMLVHFVVVAAARTRMEELGARKDLRFYGAAGAEWTPYRSALNEALGTFAHGIAAEHRYESRVTELAELAERSELARQNNQIIVLLLDAWATRFEETRAILANHAATSPPTTAVMIPASRDDAETRAHWPSLSQSCRGALTPFVVDDELYRSAITTHRAFEIDLPEVLTVARNRVYTSGLIQRPPDVDVSTKPPRIDGPGATNDEVAPS